MKITLLSAIIMAFVLTSCNQETKTTKTENAESKSELYACPMHPEVQGKKGEACSKCGMELTEPVSQVDKSNEEENNSSSDGKGETTTSIEPNVSVSSIISDYINLKNRLVKDDTEGAAETAKILFSSLKSFDTKTLNENQKKEYADIADDASEHAEHIGLNGGNIEHQREHFVSLSKDINDLIKIFGASQKLYQDFCPMADDGKGAIWISEIKEIQNPYRGSKMLSCGTIKKMY